MIRYPNNLERFGFLAGLSRLIWGFEQRTASLNLTLWHLPKTTGVDGGCYGSDTCTWHQASSIIALPTLMLGCRTTRMHCWICLNDSKLWADYELCDWLPSDRCRPLDRRSILPGVLSPTSSWEPGPSSCSFQKASREYRRAGPESQISRL